MVGEPEPAVPVEHEVVRRPQRAAGRLRVERRDGSGAEVDTLDRAALPARRHRAGDREPHHVVPAEAAAVVGDVHGAVGAERGAVGSAAEVGDDVEATVGPHPGEGAACDLHEDHVAVVEGDRALGELQAAGQLSGLHGDLLAGLGKGWGTRGGWMSDVSDAAIVDLVEEAGAPDGRMVTGRFLIVTLATFAYFLALGSLLPTLPRYVEDELGRERLRGRPRRRRLRGVGGADPAVGGPLRRPVRPAHPAQRRCAARRARHPRLHPGRRHPRPGRAPAAHRHR